MVYAGAARCRRQTRFQLLLPIRSLRRHALPPVTCLPRKQLASSDDAREMRKGKGASECSGLQARLAARARVSPPANTAPARFDHILPGTPSNNRERACTAHKTAASYPKAVVRSDYTAPTLPLSVQAASPRLNTAAEQFCAYALFVPRFGREYAQNSSFPSSICLACDGTRYIVKKAG